MGETAHARLSTSSSHRWLNCPPSVKLAEQFPQTTSVYAEAGRVAHSIAELKARKHFLEPMPQRTYNARLNKLQEDQNYDKGMEEATDTYLDFLKETAMRFPSAPFVALETRVDYGDIAPGGFGTADCIMIGNGTIWVIDYKNGSGVPVEAENNSQMMLYAWGALRIYAPIYGDTVQTVNLAIVQPHAGGVKSWSLSRQALTAWGETEVRAKAELADKGGGEFQAGDWCQFCPAKAQCATRAKKLLDLEAFKGAVPEGDSEADEADETMVLLSDAQIGDVLTRARDLAAWVKDLEEYAFHVCMDGGEIPGFKVVEGRGSRDWDKVDDAFAALQQRGVAEAMLYERKPVSVAGLEKILGKKAFAEMADGLVIKRPGKPALVPASDKRPAYSAAAVAFREVSADG